ncbi:extracellular protein [Companilactobacillus futsaii JCM 17355]|nr:extracellular protein [Companilactobacillus futsaii JCM 17355]
MLFRKFGENAMKKNKVKLLIIYTMTVALVIVGFLMNSMTILAVPSTKDVLQNAPAGMKVKNYMDKVDTYSGGGTNQAKITYAGDGNSYPSDTVHILSAQGDTMQLGSIWGSVTGSGTTLNGNYFDLYKPQKVSAWVYMGDAANPTIDGLAFVIQNDPNGYDAISRYDGTPKGGETLGVWGATATPEILKSPISPEKNAIQNSVAIELDSTMNKDYSWENDDSFDSKNNGEEFKFNHIAWGYPGQSGTYKVYESGFSLGIVNFKKYYYEMNHNIFRNSNNMLMSGYDGVEATVDNAWRHLVITYTPIKNSDDTITSGTIDYLFNDQFPDGTKKKYTDWNSGSGTIDLSALNAKATSGKAMWGFTAATGSPGSAKKDIEMVFENMPMVANVTPTVTMTDISTDRVIEDYEKNKNKVKSTVYNGAKINFDYQLHYDSGMADTGEITTSIGLPQNVDFKPSSGTKVGMITYTDKDGTKKTEELNFDQITEGSNLNGDKINVINLTLDAISSTNPDVEISIDGKAVASDSSALSSTTVNGEHTSYRSDEYSDDVMTPMFLISNESLKITNSNDLNQTVLSNEKIDLTGTVKYEKGSVFNGQELNAKAIIDGGKAIDTWTESTTDGASLASFNRSIDANSLELGDHTIEVQLFDSNNVVSNTLTYNVHIDDYKKLVLTPRSDAEFNVYKESSFTPEVRVVYDNGQQFYDSTITMHWILDGEEKIDKITGTAHAVEQLYFNDTYKGSDLGVGEHELIAYVSDNKRESNRITFKINVGERELTAKANPDVENITVTSDEQKPPFDLDGTYEFSDGSTEDEKLTGTYTVKNEDYEAQDPVSFTTVADGKFNFTLQTVYQNGATNSVSTIDKRMADPKSPGIREGHNEITVELHNSAYQSNTVKFSIDIPKLTPIISADDEYKVRSRNYIQVPIKFEYSNDHDYVTTVSRLNDFYKAHDADETSYAHVKTPTSDQNYSGTPVEYTSFFVGTNAGITGDGKHTIDSVAYDYYGRKSNTESFVVNVKSKEMSLNVTDYGFQPLRYGEVTTMETGLLNRAGKWDITVDSYKTTWNLYAKQDGLFYKENDDAAKSKMEAYLIYEQNKHQYSLYQENVLIASESESGLVEKTKDITENWDDDEGIFLSVNNYGEAGTYTGTIDWTLTDSVI